MQVKPFEPAHFYQVDGREMQVLNDEDGWLVGLQYERSFYRKQDGTIGRSAITIFQGDRPICCLGAIITNGLASPWMRCAENPPIFIYRLIKRHMKVFLEDSGIRRAETIIALDKTVNHRFIQRLGFHVEGKVKGYLPDMPGVRWEWVRP